MTAGLVPLAAISQAAAFVPCASAAGNGGAVRDDRPNIIFFLVDDMGWQDTSVPFWTQKTRFNELYETPNMERLAEQSVMFTQAYASSVSSPSRCSMMTGANAARHKVTNWTLRRDVCQDKPSDVLELPEWNCNGIVQVRGIPRTFVAKSFVQYLHDSGYHMIPAVMQILHKRFCDKCPRNAPDLHDAVAVPFRKFKHVTWLVLTHITSESPVRHLVSCGICPCHHAAPGRRAYA